MKTPRLTTAILSHPSIFRVRYPDGELYEYLTHSFYQATLVEWMERTGKKGWIRKLKLISFSERRISSS